jgi:hypothetical protein
MTIAEDFSRALDLDDLLDERKSDRDSWRDRPICSGCRGAFGSRYLVAHQRACVLLRRKQEEHADLKRKLDAACEREERRLRLA